MSVTTRIRSIDPDDPDPKVIAEAAAILRDGGLVAFPTETVYGLGADATNPEAVARIFAAKGRPATNPLIVHASDEAMAKTCVADWPERAEALAGSFWPGPLTLVLPRSGRIPDIVTAGLDSVGVRVPDPLAARLLIGSAGVPIAAPSANRSTGISPTTAQHVLKDLDRKVDLILDAKAARVGIESTVLDLTTRTPRILRPGAIHASAIADRLGGGRVDWPDLATNHEPATSPGQSDRHYAPKTLTIRVERGKLAEFAWPAGRLAILSFGDPIPSRYVPNTAAIVLHFEDHREAATALYWTLHLWDERHDAIVIVPPPDRPEWDAIRDRIRRAARCPEH